MRETLRRLLSLVVLTGSTVSKAGAATAAQRRSLLADEKALAPARILKRAGVASATVQEDPSKAKPLATYDRKPDKHSAERRLRP